MDHRDLRDILEYEPIRHSPPETRELTLGQRIITGIALFAALNIGVYFVMPKHAPLTRVINYFSQTTKTQELEKDVKIVQVTSPPQKIEIEFKEPPLKKEKPRKPKKRKSEPLIQKPKPLLYEPSVQKEVKPRLMHISHPKSKSKLDRKTLLTNVRSYKSQPINLQRPLTKHDVSLEDRLPKKSKQKADVSRARTESRLISAELEQRVKIDYYKGKFRDIADLIDDEKLDDAILACRKLNTAIRSENTSIFKAMHRAPFKIESRISALKRIHDSRLLDYKKRFSNLKSKVKENTDDRNIQLFRDFYQSAANDSFSNKADFLDGVKSFSYTTTNEVAPTFYKKKVKDGYHKNVLDNTVRYEQKWIPPRYEYTPPKWDIKITWGQKVYKRQGTERKIEGHYVKVRAPPQVKRVWVEPTYRYRREQRGYTQFYSFTPFTGDKSFIKKIVHPWGNLRAPPGVN
tara:strand:+ start:12537 stop:13913 length:1377 start_codon:yes stop_codon:yes gene_type:complete